MSGERLCRVGCPRERGLVCACECVCSHSAKVFVSSSNFDPNPFISPPVPTQDPAFGAHRHLSLELVRAEAGLRPLPQRQD